MRKEIVHFILTAGVLVMKLFTIFILIIWITVVLFVTKGNSQEPQIADTELLPTRQIQIGYKGSHDGIYWEVYPIVYYIQNEPHICQDPNDPRRQFQFDQAYVIPKEPDQVKGVCLECRGKE